MINIPQFIRVGGQGLYHMTGRSVSLIEKSGEEIMDQIFTEDSEQQLCNVIREIFPWVQKNGITNISTYTECVEELIRLLQAKNKNLIQPITFQTKNVKKAEELMYKKTDELQSPRERVVNTKQQDVSNEIMQYRLVINSLRSEIEEYKTETNAMRIEIMSFQQITNSLKGELSRLINNLNLMISMQGDE